MKTVASERSLWAIASCESQENWWEADAQNVWFIRLPAQCTSSHSTGYFGSVNSGQNFKLYTGLTLLLPWKSLAIFLGWESPVGGSSEKRIATGQGKEATILFVCLFWVSWCHIGCVPNQISSWAPSRGSTSLLAGQWGDEARLALAQFCAPHWVTATDSALHLPGRRGATRSRYTNTPWVLQPPPRQLRVTAAQL